MSNLFFSIPQIGFSGVSKCKLITAQAQDDTLQSVRTKTLDNDSQIYYKDGILSTYASIHGVNHPIIFLPSPLRKTVLSLAHTFPGHFGKNTTKSYINKVFTWPGISGDVKQFVESCVECHRYGFS